MTPATLTRLVNQARRLREDAALADVRGEYLRGEVLREQAERCEARIRAAEYRENAVGQRVLKVGAPRITGPKAKREQDVLALADAPARGRLHQFVCNYGHDKLKTHAERRDIRGALKGVK